MRYYSPYRILGKAILIALVSLFCGLILPSFLANRGGVFYRSTMLLKLPAEAKKSFIDFDQKQANAQHHIEMIEEKLDSLHTNTPESYIPNLISQKLFYEQQLATGKPPIQVMPMYLNPIMYVWVAMYTALGWLIFLLNPEPTKRFSQIVSFRNTVIIAITIYVVYNWTVWMRNFVLNNENRIVYSFANYDIYPAGFFMQECNTLIFAVLLAVVLQQWINYFIACNSRMQMTIKTEIQIPIFDINVHNELSRTFLYWQISSVILALGFIEFTSAFWDLIIYRHDQRYLLAGITIHSIWAVTWLILTLPLILKWYSFQNLKSKAILQNLRQLSLDTNYRDAISKGIQEIDPLGFWNVTTSGLVAIVSFLLPIIHAFIK